MLLQASQPKREFGCRFELASGVSFGASSLVGFFSSYSLTSRGDYHDSLFLNLSIFLACFEGFEGLKILKSKQSAVGVRIQRDTYIKMAV